MVLALCQCKSVDAQMYSNVQTRKQRKALEQLENYKVEKELPTYATDYTPTPAPELSQKRYWEIYTWFPTEMLVGNACVQEYTRLMGFEYVPAFDIPGQELSSGTIFFRNLKVKTRVLFKNGPGWKRRVKRRIKQCREASGDFSA